MFVSAFFANLRGKEVIIGTGKYTEQFGQDAFVQIRTDAERALAIRGPKPRKRLPRCGLSAYAWSFNYKGTDSDFFRKRAFQNGSTFVSLEN